MHCLTPNKFSLQTIYEEMRFPVSGPYAVNVTVPVKSLNGHSYIVCRYSEKYGFRPLKPPKCEKAAALGRWTVLGELLFYSILHDSMLFVRIDRFRVLTPWQLSVTR